jgi:putative FmdB family regulatory protein
MLYDYKCTKCKYEFDAISSVEARHTSVCPKCGSVGNLVMTFNKQGAHVHVFKPYIDEHIDKHPVKIESLKQRKDLMKKNGLQEFVQYMPGDKYLSRWI